MQLEVLLTVLPFVVAFVVSMLFGPGVVASLKQHGVGQRISEDGPESHRGKEGTPTMGGLIILAGVFAGALIASRLAPTNVLGAVSPECISGQGRLLAVLVLMIAFAALGMADDYRTVRPVGGVRGISSKPKAVIQFLLALGFVAWLIGMGPESFVPVLYVAGKPLLSGISYWIFAVVFIVGMANFVNITDGLDGLVAGLSAVATAAVVICLLVLPGMAPVEAGLPIFGLISAIAGACLAFLWFNTNPAKVFMGDTGSLAVGVALPAIAILMHREMLLIVVGLVFIIDGFSTIIQWAVFKYTRITTGTGRRVFKKSPIHHHLEMSGWSEQTVVVRFWIMGIIAAVIGFAGAAWGMW